LRKLDEELSCWCALELQIPPDALRNLIRERRASPGSAIDLELIPGRAATANKYSWGSWLGREMEYYQECAKLVSALTWTEVRQLGGASVLALVAAAKHSYAALIEPRIPDRLRYAPIKAVPCGIGTYRLSTYRTTDPIEIDLSVLTVLNHFDGRPLAEVKRHLLETAGVTIEDELVQALVDFEVLRPE
jgi:hypothetical protein